LPATRIPFSSAGAIGTASRASPIATFVNHQAWCGEMKEGDFFTAAVGASPSQPVAHLRVGRPEVLMAQVHARVVGFEPATEDRQLFLAQGFGLAHRLLFAAQA
jgi:hypothetical protein